MIDLHSHILPAIDDGAPDWESSLAMLALAEEAGTEILVATPHTHEFWRGDGPPREVVPRLVQECNLRARRAGLKVRVLPGQECYLTPALPDELARMEWLPLGDSHTVLVELPFATWPPFAEQTIFELQVAGWTVLLAHVERYHAVIKEPTRLLPLIERGIYMQVTSTSILGTFGQRVQQTARLLLEHEMAHLIASDAHTTRTRTPTLAAARAQAAEWIGAEAAKRLCIHTPYALLLDEPPPLPTPRPIKKPGRRGWRLF